MPLIALFLLLAGSPCRADYVVQVAALSDPAFLAESAERLKKAGFPVLTETMTLRLGTPLTRLLVGPFANRTQAESAAASLSKTGWPGYIYRYPIGRSAPPTASARLRARPAPEAARLGSPPATAPPAVSPETSTARSEAKAVETPPASVPAVAAGSEAPAKAAAPPAAPPPPEAASSVTPASAAAPPSRPAWMDADVPVPQLLPATPTTASAGPVDSSRLTEEARPLEKIPERPRPLVELGSAFLGTGPLPRGFTIPGGATWQPRFLTWGILRSGIFDVELGNDARRQAWLNRLDLFGQVNFTPTERIIASFRPLDKDGQFAGYTFAPEHRSEDDHFNSTVRTLYFEGDFGELFPVLDSKDKIALDYGFAVGRFPAVFQEGMLINDPIDAVGVVRNSLRPSASFSNLRLAGIVSWANVNRGGTNLKDNSAKLFGLFTEFDVPRSTVNIDVIYVDASSATGSGVYGGISSVQRIAGEVNTTFRVLASYALDGETAAVGKGVLLYSALSWTPGRSEDVVYLNIFGAFKNYTPAARDAGLGGPLDPVGILYESVGLGSGYGNVLSNQARSAYGGALGYQRIFNHTRTQAILELGARRGTRAPDTKVDVAVALRLQQALGRHFIVRLEGFAHPRESQATQYGGRYELAVKF